YEEIFGLKREEILGRTDHEIFPKETADAFRAMDERVLATDQALTEEEMAPHTDGPHRYLSVKAPLRDDTRRVQAMVGISTDITEHKRAEQRLREHFERMSLLDRTTRAIADRQDLRSIFQVAVRSLEDHLAVDFGCIALHEPANQALVVNC